MAARKKRDGEIERELAALELAQGDPAALRSALASAHPRVVTRAATLVRRGDVAGLGAELSAAFARLAPLGADADPRCLAKIALLEALDATEWPGHEPFVSATRLVQRERSYPPPPLDTAGPVRARAILALARRSWRDLPLRAAEMLADPEPAARIAAADAIGATGGPAGALVLALARPDDDPTVIVATLAALLALEPGFAIEALERGEIAGAPIDRELAAIALAGTRRGDALELLARWLAGSMRRPARAAMLRAIGLHRSERAIAILLEAIRSGSDEVALDAIDALAPRRFDPGVIARARDAAAHRDARIRDALEAIAARS